MAGSTLVLISSPIAQTLVLIQTIGNATTLMQAKPTSSAMTTTQDPGMLAGTNNLEGTPHQLMEVIL